MPGGDFHSEALDVDGTAHRVVLVNLAENNDQVRIFEEKIKKLERRLSEGTVQELLFVPKGERV